MSDLDLAQAERTELAILLETLTPQQWNAPSLCAGWTVRDVVAHMISYDQLDAAGLLRRFARGRVVHANAVGVEQMRHLEIEELLELFRASLRPRGLAAGLGGRIGLVDGMIHQQDIRRPLGAERTIPEQRLLHVLPTVPGNPRLFAWRWIRGLRLEATDLPWSHGRGPLVRGRGEALLLAMAGRPVVLPELEGDGVGQLASRLAGRTAR